MALSKKPKTTDDLTFKEAFKFFRKKHGGDGGRFKWKGEVYTTDLKSTNKTTSKPPKGAGSGGTKQNDFITIIPDSGKKTGPSKRPAIKSPGRANAMMGPKPIAKDNSKARKKRTLGSGWGSKTKTPK